MCAAKLATQMLSLKERREQSRGQLNLQLVPLAVPFARRLEAEGVIDTAPQPCHSAQRRTLDPETLARRPLCVLRRSCSLT